MKEDARQFGGGKGNDFFQFRESGQFRFRILTKPKAMGTHFFGKGSKPAICYGIAEGCPFHTGDTDDATVKFNCYVLDRADGKIKIGELPYSVYGRVADFQENPELEWNGGEFPMPFDLITTYDKENKDNRQKYKTEFSIKRTPLSQEEETALKMKTDALTIEDYVEKRKNKQLQEHKENGIWESEQRRRVEVGAKIEQTVREARQNAPQSSGIEYPKDDINPDDIPF